MNCVKCTCNIFNVKCHYSLCFHNIGHQHSTPSDPPVHANSSIHQRDLSECGNSMTRHCWVTMNDMPKMPPALPVIIHLLPIQLNSNFKKYLNTCKSSFKREYKPNSASLIVSSFCCLHQKSKQNQKTAGSCAFLSNTTENITFKGFAKASFLVNRYRRFRYRYKSLYKYVKKSVILSK